MSTITFRELDLPRREADHAAARRHRAAVAAFEHRSAVWLEQAAPWAMRIALFAVYFWFGAVKLTGLSGATPLAKALTERTIGLHYFHTVFIVLALFECAIGVMFLFPRLARLAVLCLLVHMAMVCSPLVLVPELSWQTFLVPTLEGQYIIKNLVFVAAGMWLALINLRGAAHRTPSAR